MSNSLSLGEAFTQIAEGRRSIRAFKADPVSQSQIEQIFQSAARAPSNCNTQPWLAHIVTGEKLEELRAELPEKFLAGDVAPDYPYDGVYEGVYRDRQYASAAALYDALGIPREEKSKRQAWFLNNFRFFGAPAVCFFSLPANFSLREACDLGMFAQNVMLGLAANGLGSCPQTALGFMANTIKPKLGIGEDQILLWGLSFGYPDWDDPANDAITERAALSSILTWHS